MPSYSLSSPALLGLIAASALAPQSQVLAQGCIGLRSTSCAVHAMGEEGSRGPPGPGDWQAGVAFRWFESKRDFVGNQEVPSRYGMMVNDVYAFDVLATYNIDAHWSVTLDLPFTAASRTTAYEHDGVNRHTMRAGGLGDIRLTTDYWLFDPRTHMNGNLAFGLGFSAPTGDDAATDTSRTGRRARWNVRGHLDPTRKRRLGNHPANAGIPSKSSAPSSSVT